MIKVACGVGLWTLLVCGALTLASGKSEPFIGAVIVVLLGVVPFTVMCWLEYRRHPAEWGRE